jgi:hypothetical protein
MSRHARRDQPLDATEKEILEILREVIVERGITLREFAGLPVKQARSRREHFKALSQGFIDNLFAGSIKPRKKQRRRRG